MIIVLPYSLLIFVTKFSDNILRNQVNFELDQFSSSIHDILDKQLVHIHHVLRLSESSPNMKVSHSILFKKGSNFINAHC